MSERPDTSSWSRISAVVLVTCFIVLCYLLYLIFRSFFSILIWAAVLSVVFHPLFRNILKWTRGRRTAAAFAACFLILVLIILPVTFLGVLIGQQSIALYHNLQSNLGDTGPTTSAWLKELENRPSIQWILRISRPWLAGENIDLQSFVRQTVSAISRFVVERAPSVLAGFGGLVYSFAMVFIAMFFLFRDGPAILDFVRSSSPLPVAYELEIARKFKDVSHATFYGSILTALVQGVAGALLFWGLGVNAPLFWGALVAFASLVPIVGASLIWGPMSLYFLLAGHTARAIVTLAVGGLVVSSIDNVMKPAIIRGRTDMHPLLVFLRVLGGMEAFGFLGVLLGPLAVAIFLSFLNFFRLRYSGHLQDKAT